MRRFRASWGGARGGKTPRWDARNPDSRCTRPGTKFAYGVLLWDKLRSCVCACVDIAMAPCAALRLCKVWSSAMGREVVRWVMVCEALRKSGTEIRVWCGIGMCGTD
eukprot:991158-Rhodomonas_salina.1